MKLLPIVEGCKAVFVNSKAGNDGKSLVIEGGNHDVIK